MSKPAPLIRGLPPDTMKLMIGLCTVVFGYAAGYLAEPLGFMWAFFLSGAGSMIGVYVGWRLARHFDL